MVAVARNALAAGALLTLLACQSDKLTPSPFRPLASFSDGAHRGNPDFFFLPPIFRNPANDPNFESAAFNPNLRPTVEVCELGPTVAPPSVRACIAGDPVRRFAANEVKLSTAEQHYSVNWNTKESDLTLTSEYRIRVLLGTRELGYVDVDPVSSGSQLKNVETGQYIGLVDDRTLPIKFRIEHGCNAADACNSQTIDLSQGGFVVLQATGDRVDIPAQSSGQIVNVTVDLCDGIDVDLPVFGNCLHVSSNPPLAALLSPPATVSMCSIRLVAIPLPHPQQDLLTLHRQDDAVITALPHSADFCAPVIGTSAAPQSLFAAAWKALRHAVASILPQPLYATTLVLDVGPAGDTEGFSDFQFALPAKIDFGSLVDQVANPFSAVRSVPTAVVTDADDNPVPGARVHFEITSGDGSSITPANEAVTSGANGLASLTEWRLGAPGPYRVRAFGRGIADPKNNGPAEGFDPFAPAIFHDADDDKAQPPVIIGTGSLFYTATAGAADLVISTGTPTISPITVVAGGTVELSAWTNFNQGSASPTSNVENGFYLSTDPVITTSDVRLSGNTNSPGVLAPGAGFAWGGPTLTIPATTVAGNYFIGILVDETNTAAELDEGNNYVSTSLTVTRPIAPPGAPTGLTFRQGAAGGFLAWNVPNNNGGAISGYTIEVRRGPAVIQTLHSTANSLSFTDLPMCDYPNLGACLTTGQYSATVAASNEAGVGARSTLLPFSTLVSFVADGLMRLFEQQGCQECHNSAEVLPNLVGTPAQVFQRVSALPDGNIYVVPSGTDPRLSHPAGTLFSSTSYEYDVLSRWVRDGKFP